MSDMCPKCNGKGRIVNNGGDWGTQPDYWEYDWFGNPTTGYDNCNFCGGTGYYPKNVCKTCDGRGLFYGISDTHKCASCGGTGER
jgi:hypothetical protein